MQPAAVNIVASSSIDAPRLMRGRYVRTKTPWSRLCSSRDIKEKMAMNSALKALPIDERIRLVEDLWDSIAADQMSLPLTDAQRTELDHRLDAYEADGNRGKPAAEIAAGIRSSL